jgi:hypothetical protein
MDKPPMEKMQPTAIEVLGDHVDGAPEREYKQLVSTIFRSHPAVAEAYLLRVRYAGDDSISVALGVQFANADVDERVINEAGMAFHTLFGRNQHLDIIPLTKEMTEDLNATPFYVARFESTG